MGYALHTAAAGGRSDSEDEKRGGRGAGEGDLVGGLYRCLDPAARYPHAPPTPLAAAVVAAVAAAAAPPVLAVIPRIFPSACHRQSGTTRLPCGYRQTSPPALHRSHSESLSGVGVGRTARLVSRGASSCGQTDRCKAKDT